MATRAEKIAFIQAQQSPGDSAPNDSQSSDKTRAEKIAFIQAAQARPKSSMADTALEGFGKGASLGYLPQMQAGVEKATDAIGDLKDKALQTIGLDQLTSLDAQLRKQGFKLPDSTYVEVRDSNIKRQAQQAKDNPITAGVSNVAGGVATGIATAPLMAWANGAKAVTLGGKIGQGMLQGARTGIVYGAAANPGDIEGEISPLQLQDRGVNAFKGGLLGAGLGAGAAVVGAGYQGVKNSPAKVKAQLADKIGQDVEFTPKANPDRILTAAKNIGIDESHVPKAVLSDNPTYQDMESGLSQSGSLVARPTRTLYNKFFDAIDAAKEKISGQKTPDSKFASGSGIKDDLTKAVEDQRAPVSEMYDDMAKDLKKVPVDQSVVNKVFAQLKRNPLFQNQQGRALLEDHKSMVLDQPELSSLKELRSTVRSSLGKDASDLDQSRVNKLAEAITQVRNESVNAQKANLPARMHSEVDNLIDQITLADRAHASNIGDVNSIKGLIGNKPVSSPGEFMRKLGQMSEEDLAKRASNLDTTSMKALQKTYPSVFEKVQQARVNDMIARSTTSNGFNDTAFLNQYGKMGQEMKDLVFQPELQSHIDSLQTLKLEIPKQLGPSGTPKGISTMEAVSPKRNALDYGTKKILEGTKPASPDTASIGTRPATMSSLLQLAPKPSVSPAANAPDIQKAADKKPTKGPEKWANDGFNKLIEHDPKAIDGFTQEDLLKDPKTKDLLIQASDLKPGSKAFDAISVKIQSRLKQKGD